VRKTRNLAWVQKALGHASINTTKRHYAHVLNDACRGCFAGPAKVARKVSRSAECETGGLGYVIDFKWWARQDSNLQPSSYERVEYSEKSAKNRYFRTQPNALVVIWFGGFIGYSLVECRVGP
jgi:hypothetical protein